MNFENRFQFSDCWLPATPEKPPSLGRANPLAENPQVNHSGINHWPETQSYDFFDPNSQAGWDPGYFTAGGSAAEQDSAVFYHQQCLPGEVSTEWNNVPLLQLLQGDSGLVTSATRALMPDLHCQTSNFRGDCSFGGLGSSLSSGSVVDNGYCQIGKGRAISFSSVDHGLASEQFDNGRSLHQTDDFSRSSMINYDLNVSPTTESHFTPVMPNKEDLLTVEKHHSALSSTSQSENLVQKPAEVQQHCGELLQNMVDLSSSTLISTPNKDSDKTTDLGIDLNGTPQQKTPKRRKHRPKVVVEGKPKRIPKNTVPKTTEPKPKRKYVRKNVLKDSPAPEVVDTIKDSTKPNPETAQKSCKKVLIFDVEDENPSDLGTTVSVPVENPKKFSRENHMEGKTDGGFVALLNRQEARRSLVSENDVQVWNSCAVSRPETNSNAAEPENGNCSSFGNFNEMDLEKVKELMQSILQPIPKTPFKSCEQRGSKRDHSQTIESQNLYSINYAASSLIEKGCQRNEHNLQIGTPQIGKKQKAADEYRDVQTNTLLVNGFSLDSRPNSDATLNPHSRCGLSEVKYNERILFTGDLYIPPVDSTLRLHPTVEIVPSNHDSCVGGTKSTEIPDPIEPNGAILQVYNTKPKMSKKMGVPQRKTDLSGPKSLREQVPKRRGKKTKPTYCSTIDEIIDRFRILDLNGNGDGLQKRDQNALVLYKGEGALVPYEDGFIKQRKLRPKVDLDPESNRIWNLLMGKEGSEEAEQNDKKEKWWEEERKVFRGRVDSFIARMHLVQGDRRFSRWKGSVVDSVIGVFLTQNVSDHLSSSAFMSMAARFPLKSSSNTHKGTTNIIDLESPILSQESFDSSITQVAAYSGSNSETEDPPNGNKPRNGLVYKDCTVINEKSQLKLDSGNNHMLPNSPNYICFQPSGGNNVLPDSSRSVLWWRETFSEESISSWKSPAEKPVVAVDTTSEVDLQAPRVEPILKDQISSSNQSSVLANTKNSKARKGNSETLRSETDWDDLRKRVEASGTRKERREDAMDSLDYEAVRNADVRDISDSIKERGMSNVLAGRMKEFLNRVVEDHGSIDLEWLRDVPPDKAKDYLLSIRGLGLKSVECVRLLTLHHLAFPVDTNVGRIAVRLGWVPLRPLPESLQLHLLELYPILESIQKYLWPRLCKLDQRTLYELHYQMITFGKVFCTKSKPNCNACPMRGECRHFASAFASARLALPGPEERHIVSSVVPQTSNENPSVVIHPMEALSAPPQTSDKSPHVVIHSMEALPAPPHNSIIQNLGSKNGNCEPIIEEPTTPEQEHADILESDIEDSFYEDPDEIPTIKLDMGEFRESLQSYMQKNMEIQEADVSKALVALTPDIASLPIPKLKNVNRLRTEHQVYELPDSHPLLERLERRERDDPSPYLLAIWTPGETANSIQPPEKSCGSEPDKLCDDTTCFSCNSVREANSQTVRGTILIPCRTAMRGSFPLNGTYFQVNEVFADHESSLSPIDVPRGWIWNLPMRTVYFGTSVSSIFKGLTTEGIQYCFWKGFVCVRGFDLETRAPRPLKARLHFPASKLTKNKQDERR